MYFMVSSPIHFIRSKSVVFLFSFYTKNIQRSSHPIKCWLQPEHSFNATRSAQACTFVIITDRSKSLTNSVDGSLQLLVNVFFTIIVQISLRQIKSNFFASNTNSSCSYISVNLFICY